MLFELCIDQTAVSISTDSSFSWIYENAAKYGFIERYPEAKSSITGVSNFDNAFRYVGEAHAKYISAKKICLEEYVDLIKTNGANPTDIDGYKVKRIEIPNGETVELSLPSRATVSGDNVGGIIITYK
jgi:D-alanyl-D-alanine carboxypeptidase